MTPVCSGLHLRLFTYVYQKATPVYYTTGIGSFFFEIKKQRLKYMTCSTDKEETSIMILKSFSYKVISKY